MMKKNLKVLLVDDDEINQLVACTFMKKWGIAVTTATDGKKALELIKAKSFDLVIMDLQMPEVDGYECTRRIRAMDDAYFKEVPILVFSASSLIDSRKKATEFGMTDILNKPFRQEELRAKLGQYLRLPSQDFRPLKIDFTLHTDGEPFFKIELMQLLSDNLAELRSSLEQSLKSGDPAPFLNTAHKVASAVSILNEPDLGSALEHLKRCMKEGDKHSMAEHVSRLHEITYDIVRALEHETKVIQKDIPQA